MGQLLRSDTINVRSLAWANPAAVSQSMIDNLPPNRLGAGERSVIGYARTLEECVVGLDDWQARQLAKAMGLKVVGALGVLLRAKRVGLISSVKPHIDEAIIQGFHLGPDLYRAVLELAGENT